MKVTNGLTAKGAGGYLCPNNKPSLLGLLSAFICILSNILQREEDLSIFKLQNVAFYQLLLFVLLVF